MVEKRQGAGEAGMVKGTGGVVASLPLSGILAPLSAAGLILTFHGDLALDWP